MGCEAKLKCPDCDCPMEIPPDTAVGEIVSCHCCGLELEVKDITVVSQRLEPLTLEGEDWGE